MNSLIRNLLGGSAIALVALAMPAFAEDYTFNPGVVPTEDAHSVKLDASSKETYTLGFSNISLVNTWRVQMVEEAKYRASQYDKVGDLIVTDAGGSANKQIADIEDLIARGVDAIIVAPASETALNTVLDTAYNAGIPTIIFENNATPDNYTLKIRADDVFFGEVGAEFLANQMGGAGDIIGLRGIAGVSVETIRWESVEAYLGENYPDIKIVDAAFGDWAYDKGKQVCESLLIAHPDIDGIWSSGGAMTQACIEVFEENGFDLVPMTGESNNGFLRVWKEMGFESIAPIAATWVGAEAITAAMKVLDGEELSSDYIIRPEPITKETIDEAYKPELNDSYWSGSILPEDQLLEMYGK